MLFQLLTIRRVPVALTLTRGPTRCSGPRTSPTGGRTPRESPSWSAGVRSQPTEGCGAQRSSFGPPERIRGGPVSVHHNPFARTLHRSCPYRPVGPPARGSLDAMSPLIPSLLTATLALPVAAGDGQADPRGTGVCPLSPTPTVAHGFDPPDSEFGAGHRGVDLAGRPSQVVGAALPGQVTFAGRLAGRGVVVVSHGPTRTTYEPVRATVRGRRPGRRGTPLGVLELPLSHCRPSASLHCRFCVRPRPRRQLSSVGCHPLDCRPA
jgi:hypothetical protein